MFKKKVLTNHKELFKSGGICMYKRLFCVFFAALLLFCGTLLHGETVLRTNFFVNLKPVNSTVDRITGEVPEGWRDDSSWCDVDVDYSKETFQNDSYLKMNLKSIRNGLAQFCYDHLPDVKDNTIFKLKIRLRNRSRGQVKIGLRKSKAPYSFYWFENERFSPDWKTYTYTFKFPKGNKQEMGFWIYQYGTGELDIASLKLERITEKDLVKDFEKLKKKYPNYGPDNLLRNSRLPLGIQSGWSLYRDASEGDDVILKAENDDTAPSGLPVFKFESLKKYAILNSEPFKVYFPNLEHTCKLKVKGSGKFRFEIKHQKNSFGFKQVTLKPGKWQEIKFPFKPDLFLPSYQLLISGIGSIKIDDITISPTLKIDKVNPLDRPEVALAVPESETSVSRIQFSNTPTEIRYCVTNVRKDAVLKSKVTDLYGETKEVNDIKLKAGKVAYGKINFGVFPNKPLGCFRVESWIEEDGKRISPFNELVVSRVRVPRYWGKDAPNSPFGVHMMAQSRSLILAKAVGANWTRLHDAGLEYIGWWNLEPEKGKWTFFDEEIKRFRKNNIMIFGELGTAPKWASYYSKTGRTVFGYFDKFFQPLDLKDYRNYVKTVTERYKNDIAAYDVWNEPWIHAWWGVDYKGPKDSYDRSGFITSEEPQKDFVNMMKSAYTETKLVDKNILIAGFNTTSTVSKSKSRFSGTIWTEGVLNNGGLDYCDVLAYHGYNRGDLGYPGDPVEVGLERAFGPVFKKYGKAPKPVWMTEGSPVRETRNGLYLHTLPFEAEDFYDKPSNDLARYMMSLLANGVERHFLYSMHCHVGLFAKNVSGYRMLTNIDGYPHPSAVAHSNFAYLIEDKKFVKRSEVAKKVYVYVFSNDSRTVACISTAHGFLDYTVPQNKGLEIIDLYGNKLRGTVKAGENLLSLVGKITPEEMLNIVKVSNDFDDNKMKKWWEFWK
jgi:hypothetical protein